MSEISDPVAEGRPNWPLWVGLGSCALVFVVCVGLACVSLVVLSLAPVIMLGPSHRERPELVFAPQTLPAARLNSDYETEIQITQNVTPVGQFSIAEGELPPGLTLEKVEGINDTARIIGRPTQAGTFTFTVSVWCYGTSVNGQVGAKEYSITVQE